MLSLEAVQLLSGIFSTGTRFFAIPFLWNPKTIRLFPISLPNWRFIIFYLSVVAIGMDFSGQFIRLFKLLEMAQQNLTPKDTIVSAIYELYVKLVFFRFYILFASERHSIARQVNLFLQFYININEAECKRNGENVYEQRRNGLTFLNILIYLSAVLASLYVAIYFTTKTPTVLGFKMEPNASTLKRIFCAPLFFLNQNYVHVSRFSFSFWVVSTFSTIDLLNDLNNAASQVKRKVLMVHRYKCLEILNKELKASFGVIIPHLVLLALGASVISLTTLIRLFSGQSNPRTPFGRGSYILLFARGMLGTLLACFLLPKFSTINRESRKVVSNWQKYYKRTDAFYAEVKSLNTLRIYVSDFYYFQRHTSLRVIASIFYLTGRLILLLKK